MSFIKLSYACSLMVLAACVEDVPIGEGVDQDSGGATRGSGGASGSDRAVGTTSCAGAASNCGGSGTLDGGCGGAPAGPYGKAGEEIWREGTAGNPYGWPRGSRPTRSCTGFGFHDTCNFWELCAVYCRLDEHCPSPAGGPLAVCRDAYTARPPALGNYCVLPCPGGQPCPDGMECVNHPYGHGEICMWQSDPLL